MWETQCLLLALISLGQSSRYCRAYRKNWQPWDQSPPPANFTLEVRDPHCHYSDPLKR